MLANIGAHPGHDYGEGNLSMHANDYLRYYLEQTGSRFVEGLDNRYLQCYEHLRGLFQQEQNHMR